MEKSDSIIIIPTYNEKENVERMIRKVFSLTHPFHILIVDDGSPDGTADAVEATRGERRRPDRIHVLRRAADLRGVFLSDEVMDFMLNRFSRDLSSLMLLLETLDGYALRTQRAITIPLIKAMLENE